MDISLAVDAPTQEEGHSSSDAGQSTHQLCPSPCSSLSDEQCPDTHISEEEAVMAVALTEYFQKQRKAYNHVGWLLHPCIISYIILL